MTNNNVKEEKAKLTVGGFIVSQTQMIIDLKMVGYDIRASLAHTLMLHKVGVIKKDPIKKIITTLQEINEELNQGNFMINPDKGAQLSLEARIVEKAGDIGYSVHTGRSRNDQIMITEMLYLREEMLKLMANILEVHKALLNLAKKK